MKQGLSSTTVALLSGGDAITGILCTFLFPVFRKKISLTKIVLFSMMFHFLCGSLCTSSNWLEGSPFDATFFVSKSSSQAFNRSVVSTAAFTENENYTMSFVEKPLKSVPVSSGKTSLIVFAVGVIVGRLAFWMIDLTGSQLLLENIRNDERGTICAVHYSLKKLMNRMKYVLALFLAWPQTFGFLIIASQLFSMIGYSFFIVYCKRKKSSTGKFTIHSPVAS